MSAKLAISLPLSVIFALLILAVAGCKTTNEVEGSQMSKVIGLGGEAQFSVDDGKTWRPIRLGKEIAPGALIRTAEGSTNGVMLAVAHKIRLVPSDPRIENELELYGSSLLKLEKVTAQSVAGHVVADIRIKILEGYVKGDAWTIEPNDTGISPIPGPKLETIQKQPNQNYYEVRGSNVVVHMEHTIYVFDAAGSTRILQGAAALEFTDTGLTKDLFPGSFYDSVTGTIRSNQVRESSGSYNGPDWRFIPSAPKIKSMSDVRQRQF